MKTKVKNQVKSKFFVNVKISFIITDYFKLLLRLKTYSLFILFINKIQTVSNCVVGLKTIISL